MNLVARVAMTSRMPLTAAVTRAGTVHVAQCLELDVASQGHSVEEALANLREALPLLLEGDLRDEPPVHD